MTHSVHVRLKEAIDMIIVGTNGRVAIQLFTNKLLGRDSDMVSQIRAGALELATFPGKVMTTLIPGTSITGVGFAFDNCDKVWAAMDGEVGNHSRRSIEKVNLVPVVPLWVSMFKSSDAAPVSLPLSEACQAQQIKVADGQENPLALIDSAKFFEVQKYCSLMNHSWDGFWFLANARVWKSLPVDVQQVMTKHINSAVHLAPSGPMANQAFS